VSILNKIPNPFEKARKSNILGNFAIVTIYAGIYLRDWASQWLSNTVIISALAGGVALAVGALLLGAKAPRGYLISSLGMLVLLVLFWTASFLATGKINTSSYYVSILFAIIVVNLNPRLFIIILLFHFAAALVISGIELISGQYLFDYVDAEGLVLDEKLFGGGTEVFRAKGLSQGPLSQVAFALWMAFLIRGSVFAGAALFLAAFFASGRLGMLTALILMLSRASKNWSSFFTRLLPFAIVLALVVVTSAFFIEENRLLFISSALNLDNDQNVSRFEFWSNSLRQYFLLEPLNIIFGDYGLIAKVQGGTENDFLRLLMDCGFVGFALYFGAIAKLFSNAIRRRNREDFVNAVLITVLMNIFPFVQSLSSSFLFWVYFFATTNRPRLVSAKISVRN
jgi:hypothetical protein